MNRTAAIAAAVTVMVAGACSGPRPTAAPRPAPRNTTTEPAHYTVSLDENVAVTALKTGARPALALRGDHGAVVFHLSVPVLGLHRYPVRMGVTENVLALGPGVYRGSAAPGSGHVVTAGHTVTPVGPWSHGPYRYLERLHRGDVARIQYHGQTFAYRLVKLVQVLPENTSVLRANYDLTMTSCYPPGSAAYRLVAQWEETS